MFRGSFSACWWSALAGRAGLAQDPQLCTPQEWLAQLKDADPAKRRQAVVALGSAGPDLTKAMIQQVGAASRIPRRRSATRRRSRWAISVRRRRRRLTEIRAAVKDPSPLVRRAAVFALGNLGTAAKDAVPELIAALGDDNETVRHAAGYALGSVGEEAKAATGGTRQRFGQRPRRRRPPGGGVRAGGDRLRRRGGGTRSRQGTGDADSAGRGT